MSDSVIPADAGQFLLKSIDSIAQLEGLLWLRAHAGESWDAATLSRQLYIPGDEAAVLLERLSLRGLVAIEEMADLRHYVYRPATAELDAMVARVDDLYRQYLIPVTHLIHAKPKPSIEAFADAFRLRKDKP